MKHIWAKVNYPFNNKVTFKYLPKGNEDKLILTCSNYYTVYFDNKLISYGPERTCEGYARIREIQIPKGIKEISVLVFRSGIPTLDEDEQSPFIGCDFFSNGQLVSDANALKAYESTKYINRSCKNSWQRGFVERFDFRDIKETQLETFEVKEPRLLKGVGDTCLYREIDFTYKRDFPFIGFDNIKLPNYLHRKDILEYQQFDIEKEFLDVIKNGYHCYDYELSEEKSGLLRIRLKTTQNSRIFIVFDEYLENGKWTYGRSSCNDLITIETGVGEYEIISSTVYSLKHLRILSNSRVLLQPSMILIQNDYIEPLKSTGNSKIDAIVEAGRNTYIQNAVDIFTDCPGRERGGWLCDSYFTSMSEYFFTGKNKIERCFLENIILADCEEIEKGMLPMVFPAQSIDGTFIPNWAMWFVLELEQYYKRTGDQSLIDLAKDKVFGLVNYFNQFENEYGLLENLRSWVFVEWSSAGTEEYVKGLNFPTNMLYAAMLDAVASLYANEQLHARARVIREYINKLAFNGKLYIDNAIRKDGKLVLQEDHTSETCQYYALFFKLNNDKQYVEFIKNEFGPLRKDTYPEVARSNSFIGNYLRFLWLKQLGEKERIKKECLDYFYKMAEHSGTLWEKDVASASCNHGFASSIVPILLED